MGNFFSQLQFTLRIAEGIIDSVWYTYSENNRMKSCVHFPIMFYCCIFANPLPRIRVGT